MSGKTIGEAWREIAGERAWQLRPTWPPDLFAFTSVVLADSGAYRLVISPHSEASEHQWPPILAREQVDGDYDDVPRSRRRGRSVEDRAALRRLRWQAHLEHAARVWRDWAEYQERRRDPTSEGQAQGVAADGEVGPPTGPGVDVVTLCSSIARSFDAAVASLITPEGWSLCQALLELHALADLASAGFGVPGSCAEPGIGMHARQSLLYRGTISEFGTDRIRVLPKLRTPQTGLTIRSLSHNLAIDRSEVKVNWQTSTMLLPGERAHELNLLVIPWPYKVRPEDFRASGISDLVLDPSAFGFFEYEPEHAFDPELNLMRLLGAAEERVGQVSAVILPESALSEEEADQAEAALGERVGFLLAGVRGVRRNYAYLGVRHPSYLARYCQDKHHRWRLDASQIAQYGLAASLDAGRLWWEPMRVRPREINFVCANPWLCMAPLICEDLARPDPVADVIRAVGPNLVIALLMDGPQLAARWPGRYASVLADDPGSSILTVTSLGMALRSVPPGMTPKRTIALWKDPADGAREIDLEPGAAAVVLTIAAEFVEEFTADGRSDHGAAVRLVLTGVQQIRAPKVSDAETTNPGDRPLSNSPAGI
ncbi:hypothetical protein ENSA5_03240 [Enhygromyxa salina]|uniref:Uncharacterized protein n=1 Tax=Enhygromyxa salina TaxID=215803 RepID=A0A2S9YJQ7_9BACT|nr:hypothetical protein [Enhygromyxa salina]PRQ05334.1 hypothetical protein ENSA5_03240 [Enhygromyxa salina]